MINLIPPTAQRDVKREYWIRVITVWLCMLGVASAIAIVLYIPTYVLIQSQLVSYTQEFEQINTESQAFKEARTQLTQSNTIARALGVKNRIPSFTTIMKDLYAVPVEGIELYGFEFATAESALSQIRISGNAVTRADLTAFTQQLDADTRFSDVDLPLSQLAEDRDIAFTVTLTWAQE